MTMRALIVDDDQTFCQFLATVLTRKGIDVTWTTDGLASYNLARQFPYDLFILDVRMPQVLGTDLAADLKKDHPSAQIILISAFADAALQQTASQLGVAILSKPFPPNRLTDMIVQLLGQQM
jgi:DNA-binding response OmpR family regulator